jgi:FkbM family methyltransferase
MAGSLRIKSRILKRLNRLRKKPVVYDYENTRFLLNGQNWIDNRLLSGRGFEVHQIEKASALIKQHKLDLLLDIGANFGFYTMVLCNNLDLKEAHAFEPVKRNQYQFHANTYLNTLWDRVILHPVALGSEKAETSIYIDPNSTGISRLDIDTAERGAAAFSQSETIKVEVLDKYLELKNRRIFIKIDVEGHEMATLAGMVKTLKNNHVVLQIEVDKTNRQTLPAFMQKQGFECIDQIDTEFYFTSKK